MCRLTGSAAVRVHLCLSRMGLWRTEFYDIVLAIEVVALGIEHLLQWCGLSWALMTAFIFFGDGDFLVFKCWPVDIILYVYDEYFEVYQRSCIVSTSIMKMGHCVGGNVLLGGDIFGCER